MKEGIIRIIIGSVGIGLGFVGGALFTKKKYNNKVLKEIEEESKKAKDISEEKADETKPVETDTVEKKEKPSLNDTSYGKYYIKKGDDNDWSTVLKIKKEDVAEEEKETTQEESDDEEEEEDDDIEEYDVSDQEFIEEEEMASFPFDDVTALFYFDEDAVLTDMHYNVITNYASTIGTSCYLELSIKATTKPSGGVLYIVNERQEEFYKIIIKHKSFASVSSVLKEEDGQ